MDIQILLEKVSLWLTEWQRNTCCFSTCAGTCLKSTLGVLENAVLCWVCWLSCNAEVGHWGSQMWCRSSRDSAEKLPDGWEQWWGRMSTAECSQLWLQDLEPGELAEGLVKVWVLRTWCFNIPPCNPDRVPQERTVKMGNACGSLLLLECLFSPFYWQSFLPAGGEGAIFKWSSTIFTEQSDRVNLELKVTSQ